MKRVGPALRQAALVHLEMLEALLPKEPQTLTLPDLPMNDTFKGLGRSFRKGAETQNTLMPGSLAKNAWFGDSETRTSGGS